MGRKVPKAFKAGRVFRGRRAIKEPKGFRAAQGLRGRRVLLAQTEARASRASRVPKAAKDFKGSVR